jgi:hypothetical protein
MPDTRLSQNSFTAGEISPELYGREDLQRYQLGARLVENFYIRPHGGISNRAGLRYVCEVKDSDKFVRLMGFEAAADDAYLLEVGDEYIRPIFRGVQVLDGGSPYEITTPYGESELLLMYLEQSNDVATIVHPDYAVRELSRFSDVNWTLATVTFQPSVSAPTGVGAAKTEDYTGYGSDKLPVAHTYVVSAIGANGEESLPSSEATSGAVVLGYDANYVTVTWSAVSGATEYIVYKERNGIFGFIGSTVDLTFKDDNINPDFSDGPQQGANPFSSSGNYPSLVTFAQQRRVFAATDNNPQTCWMSQSGNFKNMGVSRPAKDDDSVEFTLAAKRKQDIFHMIPLEKGMIMYTRSGEWRVTGRDGDIITPSSILTEPQSYYGCSAALKPLVVGENILFVPRAENKVRDMEYSIDVDKYVAADRTILAEHLFRNRTIVAWDYAGEPDGVIWCVMSDGALVSLTYLKEHQVWGWSRHKTSGRFLDVKTVPEQSRDTPYFLVQRLIDGSWKQYIEYLEERHFEAIEDAFFVDSGLSLDNPLLVAGVSVGSSTVLTVTSHGLSDGDVIDLDGGAFYDTYGDTSPEDDISGRYVVASSTTNTFEIETEDGDPVDTSGYASGYYLETVVVREAFDSVAGLDHLAGRDVVALCDGSVVENLTVSSGGEIEFQRKFSRIHVGLPYAARLQTLDLTNSQGEDTGITKGVGKTFLRVNETRGLKVGPNFDDMVEETPRSSEDYGEPASLKEGVIEVLVWGEDDTEQTICASQTYPLPATILGITEEIEYGGS